MKKPSKSPTVLLKQKVKDRILTKCAGKVGKSEGPSTPSGEEIPADSDVPPVFEVDEANSARVTKSLGENGVKEVRRLYSEDIALTSAHQDFRISTYCGGTFLPVENHGSTNDLARSVISKVKSARPASDLDRLERSQLRGKPKTKGDA